MIGVLIVVVVLGVLAALALSRVHSATPPSAGTTDQQAAVDAC